MPLYDCSNPQTAVQLCIVLLVRAALRYVSIEDSKPVARDLKKIYQAATVEEAEAALDAFAQAWDAKYPTIAKQWRAKWTDIITLFDFPPPIRKAIYTTNVIESVFATLRHRHKKTRGNGSRAACLAMVFKLAESASKKWRALNGSALIPDMIQGISFIDGINQPQAAA